MGEAIFGLVGVVLGGVLNGTLSAINARQRTNAEARTAALLLTEQLVIATSAFQRVAKVKTWGVLLDDPYLGDTSAWKAHRATLTTRLTLSGWGTVSSAFYTLESIPRRFSWHSSGDPIEADDNRELARTLVLITEATMELQRVIPVGPWWRVVARRRERRGAEAYRDWLSNKERALRPESGNVDGPQEP